MESTLQFVLKYVMLDKTFKKITVSLSLCLAHLLEVGRMKILRDRETLSIVRHVGLHIDFSSMKSSLDL